MPFANVSSGGFANSAGLYDYVGGAVSSTLQGPVRAGSATPAARSRRAPTSTATSPSATSGGTDCTTPGTGGGGNTHASRTQFYHLNRAKEVGRGWLNRPWLNEQLTANVNIADTCNAYWNGSTVNFFRSGGGCGNTGEIAAVSLHEYGHGLDSNDGNGGSPENGTGETYGDFTAALATHSSCIGSRLPGHQLRRLRRPLHGLHGRARHRLGQAHREHPAHGGQLHPAAVPDEPHRLRRPVQPGRALRVLRLVGGALGLRQPRPAVAGVGRRLDDRRPALVPVARPRPPAPSSAPRAATFTSNGCNTGSLWKTMRAVDDDDGNLANGTPNSAALFAAFNRHGIACTTDTGANVSFRGCTPPAVAGARADCRETTR